MRRKTDLPTGGWRLTGVARACCNAGACESDCSAAEVKARVSTYFDAVVVAGRQSALLDWLKNPLVPGPLAPVDLELHRAGRGRFVVFAWRAGSPRPDAWGEVQALAYDLSLDFSTAVAVHYDDQVSERWAAVAQGGEPLRQFGEADEVWVPYGEDGKLITD